VLVAVIRKTIGRTVRACMQSGDKPSPEPILSNTISFGPLIASELSSPHSSNCLADFSALKRGLVCAGGNADLEAGLTKRSNGVLGPMSGEIRETEQQELFELSTELIAGRMLLPISHRFSNSRMAEERFEPEGRNGAEQRPHVQPLRRGGHYAEIFDFEGSKLSMKARGRLQNGHR
jgi:hypothetical protein